MAPYLPKCLLKLYLIQGCYTWTKHTSRQIQRILFTIHVCIYTMYVRMYARTYARTYVLTYVCSKCVYMYYIYVRVCAYVCICTYICTNACIVVHRRQHQMCIMRWIYSSQFNDPKMRCQSVRISCGRRLTYNITAYWKVQPDKTEYRYS
jgi:hypothetical protein